MPVQVDITFRKYFLILLIRDIYKKLLRINRALCYRLNKYKITPHF